MPAEVRRFLVAVLLVGVTAGGFTVSFDEAKNAFGHQDWKSAALLLGKFLQESPEDAQAVDAAFLRAVALYQLGDPKASLDSFQKLDRTWPQSVYAKRLPYWKGTAALAAKQWELAARELAGQAQFPEEEPFTTRALLNLALAKIALGDETSARAGLETFTKNSHEATLLAQAWAVWGDLDRKASQPSQALARYRSSSESDPGSRWDLYSRTQSVDLLTTLGKLPEALTLVESSAQTFGAEADRWDSRRVPIYLGMGDRKNLAKVLEALWGREVDVAKKQELASNRARTAEDLGKPEPTWWLRASQGPGASLGTSAILRYAYLVEQSGHWSDAAQALDDWATVHPDAPGREDAWHRAALDRAKAGDASAARRTWDRLVGGFPQSSKMPEWLLSRGRSFIEVDDTRALVDFSRLLKDYPKAPQAGEARYQTGLVYLRRQEPARAEAWFYGLVQDLKSGDLYERALLARGVSFVNAGQTDLARSSLERLLREDPRGVWSGAAWAALGRNALQARLFDEASQDFTQAETALTDPAEKAKALWSLAEARTGAGSTASAAEAYRRYAAAYADQPRVAEALYRQGLVWFSAKDWNQALQVWQSRVGSLKGQFLAETREGIATALLRLGRTQEGWDQLETLEAAVPSPEAWYRWGQAATAMGLNDWAVRAFTTLLQKHPTSAVAEAALPRAAGALLTGGKPQEALDRYADYFRKFGTKPSSAPVARAAATAALAFPKTLEALVTASQTWNLAPEVAAEFALIWAQSRLDSDAEAAKKELGELSRSAPWTSQRSQALAIWGRWNLGRGQLAEARTALEAAANLGDDLSVFRARWALAQVTDKEGDLASGARQREAAENTAGPGVPLEFRLQALAEAVEAWKQAGKPEEAQRVQSRINALTS